jgi:hypothetical protein
MRYARLAFLSAAIACCTGQEAATQSPGSANLSRHQDNRTESLKAFEQQIEDAVSRRDHVFLNRITAPTFTRTDQNGKVEDRGAVFAQIRKPPPSADIIRRTIDRETQQVQIHGDIGVARSETEVRGPRRAFASTAVKVYRWRASGWQLLSHTTISVVPLTP